MQTLYFHPFHCKRSFLKTPQPEQVEIISGQVLDWAHKTFLRGGHAECRPMESFGETSLSGNVVSLQVTSTSDTVLSCLNSRYDFDREI